MKCSVYIYIVFRYLFFLPEPILTQSDPLSFCNLYGSQLQAELGTSFVYLSSIYQADHDGGNIFYSRLLQRV